MDLVINSLTNIIGKTEEDVYIYVRKALDIDFEYNEVDTCAGEYKAFKSIFIFNQMFLNYQKLKLKIKW